MKYLVLFLTLLVASCSSEPERPEPVQAPAVPLGPWTTAFGEPAVLIADVIRIEGPEDLVQHFATMQDPEITEYRIRTTNEGLLQETTMKQGVGGAQISAQIDGWELKALKKLIVLQRFEDVPVTIRGQGNAFWASATGGGEQRSEELVFRGARGE